MIIDFCDWFRDYSIFYNYLVFAFKFFHIRLKLDFTCITYICKTYCD